MTVLSQGAEDSRSDIVFGRKYNGRRLIIVHHYDTESDPSVVLPKPNMFNWYCGYMQVLPTDKNYKFVRNGEMWNYDFDSLYPHASGGVTLVGNVDFEPMNYYVGFDTAHYFNRNWNDKDCIRALKDMADYDQPKIDNFKQLGE